MLGSPKACHVERTIYRYLSSTQQLSQLEPPLTASGIVMRCSPQLIRKQCILTYDVCATSSMPDGAIQFAANIIDTILCVEICLAVGHYNQSHRVK